MKTKRFIQLTCKEATLLFTQREEHPLGVWMGFRLSIHLKTCPPCKRFMQQNIILSNGLKGFKKHESILPYGHLSREKKTVIQQKIDTESASNR
jgi:hypothetical protein